MKITLVLLLIVLVACATTSTTRCTEVVSYLFIGTPGQRFTFNDEQIIIPRTGYIELLATGHDTAYLTDKDRPIHLAAFPLHDDGQRIVDITPTSTPTPARTPKETTK